MKLTPACNSRLAKFFAVTALAGGLSVGPGPIEASAASRFCPHFLAQYCVVKDHQRPFTKWTNPCFAEFDDLRILHRGRC
jgi:hypothetical protein